MATITRTREIERDAPDDEGRGIFSVIVLAGTIAFAGAGMALAILLGAYSVQLDTLIVKPIWR
jgi:hypothetical protein